MTDVAPAPVEEIAGTPFETLMGVEGRWTGDRRFIMPGALRWDGLLPMAITADHGSGCLGVVARVDEIRRVAGGSDDERFIIGTGVFDDAPRDDGTVNEAATNAVAQVRGQFLRGVSFELDDMDLGGVDPSTIEDEEDLWSMVVESARIRGLAIVTSPAFAEAHITLASVDTDAAAAVPAVDGPVAISADEMPELEQTGQAIIIASAGGTHTIEIPDLPPSWWFAEPTDVEVAGALTITDEGRVYGLLAPAGVTHLAPQARGATMPRGVDFGRFMRGETLVEGGRVVTGNLTMNCGHGTVRSSAVAVEHYDNSCSLLATVAVGENEEGTWVAGALLPGVDAERVQRAMACQLSGHWVTGADGRTELIAALLVPVPGFAVGRSRPSVSMRDGALVASAVPVRLATEDDCGCGGARTAQASDAAMLTRIEALERHVAPLRPLAAEQLKRKLS